jgi:hypothetical protein
LAGNGTPMPDNTVSAIDNTQTDAFHRLRIAPAGLVNDINQDSVLGDASTGPVRNITVADLIRHGFLPVGYGNNATGVYRTPLGHQILIIAANVPVTDDPTVNADAVASAYIFILPGPDNNTSQINDIVIGLRKEGVSVSAPLFSAAGVNLTGTNCRGTPAVAIWDTGCLNDAEFTALTGIVDPDGAGPLSAFPAGGLVIPAWRAAQFDLRAVMRYPQPENPGYATMLTGLSLGEWDYERDGAGNIIYRNSLGAVVPSTDADAVASCDNGIDPSITNVLLDSDTGANTVRTSICTTRTDDSIGGVDRRFDIQNVNRLETNAVIVTPQNAGVNDVVTYHDGTGYVTVNTDDNVRVDLINNTTGLPGADGLMDPGGNLFASEGLFVKGDATVLNDVRVYGNAGGGTTLGDAVFGGSAVLNNAAIASTIQELSTDQARTSTYNQDAAAAGDFNAQTIRLNTLDAQGALTVTNNMTVETINANSGTINMAEVTLSGNVVTQGGINIPATSPNISGTPYKMAIANLSTGVNTVDVGGNLDMMGAAANSAEFNGTTTIGGTLHVNGRCLSTSGHCPDRCSTPGSPLSGGTICP